MNSKDIYSRALVVGRSLAALGMTRKRLYLMSGLLLAFIILIKVCHHSKPHLSTTEQRVHVQKMGANKSLFFTGNIKPLHEMAIISPMDAVIDTMHYQYGQRAGKDEVLFVLNSTELQRQYNDALTEYLKTKDNFTVARAKFSGTQDLWNSGLLAKNNYLSEKSNLDTARISLLQTTKKLTDLLEKMDDSTKTKTELSQLNIAEFEKIRAVLSDKHNLIHLKAKNQGILLYPPKSSEDKSGQMGVGSSVKSGQVLALLGDMHGIRVDIDVPEIDIGKIHPGLKAYVTGVALGQTRLEGRLVAVNAQAFSSSANALPSFSAVIEVKNLDKKMQNLVKIGMSASIELIIDEGEHLRIPIAAVKTVKGQSLVQLEDSAGQRMLRQIKTGASSVDSVMVESGLREGDVLVYGK